MSPVFKRVLWCVLVIGSVFSAAFAQDTERGGPIHLVSGKVLIDGEQQAGAYFITKDQFKFLYFYVPSRGLFVISNREFAGALNAGTFSDRKLQFQTEGVDFKLVSATAILDKRVQPAWVRYDRTFTLNVNSIMFGYGDTESAPYDWPK